MNLSMQGGVVPRDFKQALVNPRIKKQTMCKNYQNNYRPIANLSFLSKVFEKVVANRLHEHIYKYHLSNDLQSVYTRFYSTEMALLKIHNVIVDNMDYSIVIALTLLDLSSAFDTIDHLVLIQHLHKHFGISGTFVRWSNHIFQTDTKAFSYLAHYLGHNTFRSECRKDPSSALLCLAYLLRLSAKSLLIVI